MKLLLKYIDQRFRDTPINFPLYSAREISSIIRRKRRRGERAGEGTGMISISNTRNDFIEEKFYSLI